MYQGDWTERLASLFGEREAIIDVGGVPMQNVIARLSATPGGVRFPARPLGADTDEVVRELD